MTSPLPPGSTIGMLGSGQLGRMAGWAARRLGYRFVVLSDAADAPATHVADESIVSPLIEPDGYRLMAHRCDVLTYEFENVPAALLADLDAPCPILPHPDILHMAQDRLREKGAIRALNVLTAEYTPVHSLADLERGLGEYGRGVLKRVTGGYDGKGQAVVEAGERLDAVYEALSGGGADPLILEAFVPYTREVSVIVARSRDGEVVTYPCVENIHRRGILHLSLAPARIPPSAMAEAEGIAAAIAEGLGLVGVMGVELFDTPQGMLVNELAPRPHNSGHFTLDACFTSQFEQQIRAVAGLPLGSPRQHTPAVMLNLLGEHMPGLYANLEKVLADPMLRCHLYGKEEAREGRKMGHITALASSVEEALERLERIWPLLATGDEPLL